MEFQAEKGRFISDGKEEFLVSGEIHYFRLDPALWEKHLTALKKTGANATSTYIPWDWHEYEEGKFDFTGETEPARNIIGYIKLVKKKGLNLIVKPGPYILAEYEGCGLPGWFMKKFPGANAVDYAGEKIAPDIMTYMADDFLKYTFLWYDKIMPLIAKYQCAKGGPITMLQVCNETGIFQWLSGRIDYHPAVLKLYAEFIKDKYIDISNLNRIYGSQYSGFDEIKPPKGAIGNKQEYAAYYDFHLFYRDYFEKYFDTLINKIRSFGITTQLTHNIPGWIFGHASELPMLISTYSAIMKKRTDVTFGLDHIPEFFSFRNAHSDLACNRILEAMQTSGPVWAAEFQAGTREYHVKSYANDMEAFYLASLAHGLKGFNFYMFSQGQNPENKGFFGKTFYFQTALDYRGEKLSLFEMIKKTGKFINAEKENLLESVTEEKVAVGLYKPYFYTELTTSQMLREKRLFPEKLGLYLDPRFVREAVLFDGLLRGLQTINVNYRMLDLENTDVKTLLKYGQLWVTTTEFMDGRVQALLASFVREGGHLIIYPAIPTKDEYLADCTVLRDALSLDFQKEDSPNKLDIFGIKDLYSFLATKQIFKGSVGEAVAWTKDKKVCGLKKNVGKGWVLALGFAFGFTADEHLELYKKILHYDGLDENGISISDETVQYVLRKAEKYDYLFLINYHNEKKRFTVNGKSFTLAPFSCQVSKLPHTFFIPH